MKKIVIKNLYFSRISKLILQITSKRGCIILAYHRFASSKFINNNKLMPGMYVSVEAFEKQIKWLRDYFEIVSLSSLVDDISSKRFWDNPRVVITIDDGWMDNYTHASPLLVQYNVPATVFITEKYMGTNKLNCYDLCFELICGGCDLPRNLTGIEHFDSFIEKAKTPDLTEKARQAINIIRSMSFDQINTAYNKMKEFFFARMDYYEISQKYNMLGVKQMRHMSQFNIDFGYHSKQHYMLTNIPIALIKNEVIFPAVFEQFAGISWKPFFCYPDGQFNSDIINILKQCQYKAAVSLVGGVNSLSINPFVLRRVNIHEGNSGSIPDFVATIGIFNR